ncbi:MAG: hypothetical protein K2W95_11280 [Candidatus Obscuribacterales bacterium]|nr:hypothetical protein [Candidatus Obscuribacterales bacterium]
MRRIVVLAAALYYAVGSAVSAQALFESSKTFGFGAGMGAALAGKKLQTVKPTLTAEQLSAIAAKCAALKADASAKEKRGDLKGAADSWTQIGLFREQNMGPGDKQAGEAFGKAANLYESKKDWSGAEGAWRKVLANCARRSGPGSDESAPVLERLSKACEQTNKTRDAASFLRQNLAILEKKTPGDPALESRRTEAAEKSLKSGDFLSAEEFYKDALDSAERRAPSSKPSLPLLSSYAETLRKQGKIEQAAAVESRVQQYNTGAAAPAAVPSSATPTPSSATPTPSSATPPPSASAESNQPAVSPVTTTTPAAVANSEEEE